MSAHWQFVQTVGAALAAWKVGDDEAAEAVAVTPTLQLAEQADKQLRALAMSGDDGMASRY